MFRVFTLFRRVGGGEGLPLSITIGDLEYSDESFSLFYFLMATSCLASYYFVLLKVTCSPQGLGVHTQISETFKFVKLQKNTT